MRVINCREGHGAWANERVQYLTVTDALTTWEVPYYPDARAGHKWGVIWNCNTGRRTKATSRKGERVLDVCRIYVSEGVPA